MLKSLIVLVAVVFCTVWAQLPRPCDSPRQWEGRFNRIDRSTNYSRYAAIAYDATGRRVREREEIDRNATTDYYDVLRLFNERKEYRLNLRTKVCNVTALTRPFIDIGLPSDATFTDSFVIGLAGLPNEHVSAVLFEGSYEGGRYFGAVSTPDCIPLRFGYDSPTYGFEDTLYYDIKAGISDPNAFLPPSGCSGR
ncbi:hypothetical protein SNE40_009953 [Patella caerulea]|uniref:Mammalian ependymin-related protein 1 n=1 Tax=Patella caerulea TaxID=87958 RepID=A0AAN8JV19_PATCE